MPVITAPADRLTTRSANTYPAPFGLLSVVETPTAPGHWHNGVEWEHASCAPVSGFSSACEDAQPYELQFPGSRNTLASATPFTLYGTHTCSPVGMDYSASAALAESNLQRHRQEGVEAEVSSGVIGADPNFLGATDLTPPVGEVNVYVALGILANHAASVFGQQGAVIHAPRIISGLLEPVDEPRSLDHLETLTGEHLSLGGGYANLDPNGDPAAEGIAWLYVTPPVFLLSSGINVLPPDMGSSLNRLTNDVSVVAQETFLVGWDDCPLGAVAVRVHDAA